MRSRSEGKLRGSSRQNLVDPDDPFSPFWFHMHKLFSILSFSFTFISGPLVSAEVTASYRQGELVDTHSMRLPALWLPAESAPTPLLAAAPFEVTWTGAITVPKRYHLFFSFVGSGSAELTINGEVILQEEGGLGTTKSERIRLNPGEHPFQLRYQSPDAGPAQFQLHWEERSFAAEPIPPSAFLAPSQELQGQDLVYRGREIFARHLCSKCHLAEDNFGPQAMPELFQIPPIVVLTGDRLHESWVADWIADPTRFRPETNMPRLVPPTEEGRQQAADLAAFLATLRTGSPAREIVASALNGGVHYHQLGCASCHGLPSETGGKQPLAHLPEKFQPHALYDYLKNPNALSPHSRMPDFHLSDIEAAELTRYLLENAKAPKESSHDSPAKNAARLIGDAVKGAKLAKERHCGACHAGLPYDVKALPSFQEIATQSWEKTACYTDPSLHLNLPDGAGAALEALRTGHLDSLRRRDASQFAERQLTALQCHACHDQDEQLSLLATAQSQTAHLIAHLPPADSQMQSLPSLTYAGEKLHSDFVQKILAGDHEDRARPWLETRMPGYRNHSPELLAAGLAAQHGLPPSQPDPPVQLAKDDLETGRALINSQEGFACTTCHAVGSEPATSVFEVQGINFDKSHQRLRKAFYHRWMLDPTRIDPATKMPRYADSDGKTSLPIFDSEARAQFESIWLYLQSGEIK